MKAQWAGIWVTIWLLCCGGHAFAQTQTFESRLLGAGKVAVTRIPNDNFKDYYCLMVPMPLDHQDSTQGTFLQRVFVGVHDVHAPVVFVSDGYGVDYAGKSGYQMELARLLSANLVVVEHRYFGKSQPATVNYRWLTTAQSAQDLHVLRELLAPFLVGKWLGTGTSKGGQAALSHRMHYPQDVAATVVYGTAVKRAPTISTETLLQPLMATACGQRVAALQLYAFQHDDSLFPAFLTAVAAQNLDFGEMPVRLVWDYVRLEYPYSFWQSGARCAVDAQGGQGMPALTADAATIVAHLLAVVPPKYYTTATRKRWEPAYYMFYHELGYYEYAIEPFKKYLSEASYSNRYFAPSGVEIAFDRHYLQDLGDFLESPTAHSVFFVYGGHDPWALQSLVTNNRYEVPDGSHASKLADLPADMQADLLRRLLQNLALPPAPK